MPRLPDGSYFDPSEDVEIDELGAVDESNVEAFAKRKARELGCLCDPQVQVLGLDERAGRINLVHQGWCPLLRRRGPGMN